MSILVIAAHPDDEVLGCGGTIHRHTQQSDKVQFLFVCDGVGSRHHENRVIDMDRRRDAARKAATILGAEPPRFLDFPDNQLDSVPLLDVVKVIETVLEETGASTVYTHHSGDLNIDHCLVNRAVLTACRPLPGSRVSEIYAFEVASSTEWAEQRAVSVFNPQRFVNIRADLDAKIRALQCYNEEMREFPHPRSNQAITALAHWRGASAGFAAAEAFCVLRQRIS